MSITIIHKLAQDVISALRNEMDTNYSNLRRQLNEAEQKIAMLLDLMAKAESCSCHKTLDSEIQYIMNKSQSNTIISDQIAKHVDETVIHNDENTKHDEVHKDSQPTDNRATISAKEDSEVHNDKIISEVIVMTDENQRDDKDIEANGNDGEDVNGGDADGEDANGDNVNGDGDNAEDVNEDGDNVNGEDSDNAEDVNDDGDNGEDANGEDEEGVESFVWKSGNFFRTTGKKPIVYAFISEDEAGDEIGYINEDDIVIFDKVEEKKIDNRRYFVSKEAPFVVYGYKGPFGVPSDIIGKMVNGKIVKEKL